MRNIIFLLLSLAFVGCSSLNAPLKPFNAPITKAIAPNKMRARVTYYNPHEDKWGSQVTWTKVKRAKEGVTVAAHPSFKFGDEIFIPALKGILDDGKFIVQDRGGSVTRMKASQGSTYVFDIFLNRTRRASTIFANKMNPYLDVYLLNKG